MLSRLAVLVLLGMAVCPPANGQAPQPGGGTGGAGGPGGGGAGGPGGGGAGGPRQEVKPPAVEAPKPAPTRPVDCAGLSCVNGGKCIMHPTFQKPFCNCTGGYCGPLCQETPSECEAKTAGRVERQKDAAEAAHAEDRLNKLKNKCTDDAKKMLCPPIAPNITKGTCVGAISECFATAADAAAYKSAKGSQCPAGERYCDQEGICLGAGASCQPAQKCPAAKPFRCPSWSCAADEKECGTLAPPPACAAGEQRCPDGLCYPGTGGLKKCAELGVQWDGCPPGTMQCKGGKPGVCGKDEAECKGKVGCEGDMVFCGYLRNVTSGKPVVDASTGMPKPNCKAETACTVGQDRSPVPTTRPLDSAAGGSMEALSADGKKAMKLTVKAGGFKVKGQDVAVNFTIDSVPDSLAQQGSFGALFASGALLSSLISIELSAELDPVDGGLTLDIPILDEAANQDPNICLMVLKNTQMESISDVTNVTEVLKPVGVCTKGEISACSCAVVVTHFSTFGIVDIAVAYEPRIVTAAGATNTTQPALSSSPRPLPSSWMSPLFATVLALGGAALVRA
jgi:hypothetical protein